MAKLRAEQWRPVVGAESFYSVSDRGRVFSERRRQIMRLPRDSDGYPVVTIFPASGSKKLRKVHQLVLEAFVGPCPRGQQGLHRNSRKADNRLSNLRWGTPVLRGVTYELGR